MLGYKVRDGLGYLEGVGEGNKRGAGEVWGEVKE